MAASREEIRALVTQVLSDLQRRGVTTGETPVPTASPPEPEARALAAARDSAWASAPANPPARNTAPANPAAPKPAPVNPPGTHLDADRRVAIGSDHGGFALKRTLIELLRELRYEVEDCGTYSKDSCDYPDFAIKVGEAVRGGLCALGIMIDGAGIGSAMALNKMAGIRAATVHSEATAINSREHNDANVLVLGSGQMHPGHACRITRLWLATPHAGGRHALRVDKINALDEGRA